MRKEFAKLLKQVRKTFPEGDEDLVRHAYRVANKAHAGQVRVSGEPYISHSMAVAKILCSLGLDVNTVAAGLLHDVLEDSDMTRAQLVSEFGEEVTGLVDGVTKISTLAFSNVAESYVEKQASNIRKMLIATAKDVRVILIKLADRLHNMRTIGFLPSAKIERISRETLEIYAPLANRLGIAQWKWELEDHAFHHLHPQEYKEMAEQVAMKRKEREQLLQETVEFLEERLNAAGAHARVIGRPKHLYGIYQKMQTQGKSFDQVMDILALRIITQNVAGCYTALGVVHHVWPPVPGRFKDYIAIPKVNMYQSIHTTVMRDNGLPLEVQIRTEEMDRTARVGIAAHWKYKEGDRTKRNKKLDDQLQWLQQMYEWIQEAHAPEELLENVRRDFGSSDVYVFTPKGEVKELPSGATPLDFAYSIHSDVGNHCIGARANGRMVNLKYNLQIGDVIEILTSKNQTPHLSWLDTVVTCRARTRIRQRLREMGELEPSEPTAIDLGQDKPRTPPPAPKRVVRHVDESTRQKLIRIQGMKNMLVQFGKCCNPMPGHPILGYVTKNPGITVHRVDCRSFLNTKRDPARIMEASWEGEGHLETAMRVSIVQRPNVLADITNAIRPMNIDILRASLHPEINGLGFFEFVFESADEDSIQHVMRTLRAVPGVRDVATTSVKRRTTKV
jgi:GTP pyrophosphokinase